MIFVGCKTAWSSSYLAMHDNQSCPRCHMMMSTEMTIRTMIITRSSTALLEPGFRDFCSLDSFSPEHGEKKFFWHGHTADVILDINIYWIYLSWISNKYVRGSVDLVVIYSLGWIHSAIHYIFEKFGKNHMICSDHELIKSLIFTLKCQDDTTQN